MEQTAAGWRVAAVLTLAMAVSTFAISAVSVLADGIRSDLGLSRVGLGWLITAVALIGAVTSPAAGRLADRLGGKRALVVMFALGAAGLALLATVPSLVLALPAVAVAGFVNAAGNPATNAVVAGRVDARHHAAIVGVKQSGVQVGLFVAGIALPQIAVRYGWRVAVVASIAIPLAGLVVALRWVPSDARRAQGPSAARAEPAGNMRLLAVNGLLMGAGVGAIISFLPLYAHEEVGMSVAAAGAAAAAMGLVGVAGRIAWATRRSTRDRYGRAFAVLAGGGAAASAALALAAGTGTPMVWTASILAGASAMAWNAVAMLAAVDGAPLAGMGRATAMVSGGFLGGYAVAPVLFGAVVDWTNSYPLGWNLVALVFVAGGVAGWRTFPSREPVESSISR